jgi:hypothetical protein
MSHTEFNAEVTEERAQRARRRGKDKKCKVKGAAVTLTFTLNLSLCTSFVVAKRRTSCGHGAQQCCAPIRVTP